MSEKKPILESRAIKVVKNSSISDILNVWNYSSPSLCNDILVSQLVSIYNLTHSPKIKIPEGEKLVEFTNYISKLVIVKLLEEIQKLKDGVSIDSIKLGENALLVFKVENFYGLIPEKLQASLMELKKNINMPICIIDKKSI
jgi:hypothetical protein